MLYVYKLLLKSWFLFDTKNRKWARRMIMWVQGSRSGEVGQRSESTAITTIIPLIGYPSMCQALCQALFKSLHLPRDGYY